PGGFGTHDELLESITLAQTGKTHLVPIILMDIPGGTYWRSWQEFLREDVVSRGYITETEMTFFRIITSADAAVQEIKNFYRNFPFALFATVCSCHLLYFPADPRIDRPPQS